MAPRDGREGGNGAAGDRSPTLLVDSVSVRFGGVRALDDVHLSFEPGEVCGLIGPNGAGKTTFFDVIGGVRPPTSGTVEYRGQVITTRSPTWRARNGIRRTYQRQQTFGWLSVRDNVLAALEWSGGGGGIVADLLHLPTRRRRELARRARVQEALELCGISDLAERPVVGIPIGQARLVELARAIVDPPRLLLLDEPTSGLEPGQVEQVGAVIEHIRAEHRCTVILVEHDVSFVMGHCDRVVVLDLGSVIADATPEVVSSDPEVIAAYLG